MSLVKMKDVDDWIVDVVKGMQKLEIEEINDINYKLQNISLNNVDLSNTSSSNDEEKENSVAHELPVGFDKVSQSQDKPVKTIIEDNLQNIKQDEDSSEYEKSTEITARHHSTVVNFGSTQYWDLQKSDSMVEERMKPQKFHHHCFKPSYFKINSKRFDFYLNTGCPNSSSDSELKNYGMIRNDKIRKNALKYRYSRVRKDGSKSVECLCRLCPSKRWIPKALFVEHMAIAHGIVWIENVGHVALPYPSALFRQNIGRLKYYYCKCPKCLKWIRLGLIADIKNVSEAILKTEKSYDNKDVVGIYSNYYHHFMKCSME